MSADEEIRSKAVYCGTVFAIDFEGLGEKSLKHELGRAGFTVLGSMEVRNIDYTDEHPLNNTGTLQAAAAELFAVPVFEDPLKDPGKQVQALFQPGFIDDVMARTITAIFHRNQTARTVRAELEMQAMRERLAVISDELRARNHEDEEQEREDMAPARESAAAIRKFVEDMCAFPLPPHKMPEKALADLEAELAKSLYGAGVV